MQRAKQPLERDSSNGATRVSRVKPIFFIARATPPMVATVSGINQNDVDILAVIV